jgi:hypothetical protein
VVDDFESVDLLLLCALDDACSSLLEFPWDDTNSIVRGSFPDNDAPLPELEDDGSVRENIQFSCIREVSGFAIFQYRDFYEDYE